MLYEPRKVVPPFKPSGFVENKNQRESSTNDDTNNSNKQNFNSSTKHPNRLKFNKMFKKQEVSIYLKLAKFKEAINKRK
jgi:hypothetical protein